MSSNFFYIICFNAWKARLGGICGHFMQGILLDLFFIFYSIHFNKFVLSP